MDILFFVIFVSKILGIKVYVEIIQFYIENINNEINVILE